VCVFVAAAGGEADWAWRVLLYSFSPWILVALGLYIQIQRLKTKHRDTDKPISL
jgi:hypothetical protein